MKYLYLVTFALLTQVVIAQQDSTLTEPNTPSINTADRLLQNTSGKNLSIGGYGEVNFYKPFVDNTITNGTLDVQRFVLMLGYKFSDRAQVIAEIEYEHVKEVFVEQAFFQYRVNDYLNIRAGLMLIPMGLVNEFHEPTTFNGVIRPHLDKYIVPSTWREIGAGITGRIQSASLKYQLYVTNGFNGYDGTANFSGKNGLRGGRQKGAKSFMSSPTFSTKLDYYGIPKLKLGAAAYIGNSQSSAYDGINDGDQNLLDFADSTVVGIKMIGINAIYTIKGIQLRGQYVYTAISNTIEYNGSTGSDLANTMDGYYAELSYNIFYGTNIKTSLTPFVRYEKYYTHKKVDTEITQNLAYNRTDITMGLGYKFTPGLGVKADYQFYKNEDPLDNGSGQFNMGLAFWF